MGLDFLILYEHTVREYESILLLQEEMRRRGYSAEIRQLLDRKKLKYFTYKKPKVLVASCLYDDEGLNSHVYNNVGKLNKVVNLHWEQMLSDTQEAEPWFNFNGNAKKCVQTCWGEETRQRLIDHDVPPQNAPVTGAVMLDFLRPEFKGYYKDKAQLCAQHGLDASRPLWLYISSFGYASMDEAEVKELSDMAGTDFTQFAAVNRSSMAQTLDWFDRYLTANPTVQLVYRRHPSEWNSPALAELEKKHEGFHVIFEDSVKQWVVAADEILIWMSTAIAEVYFAGKGCRVLRPEPIPHEFDPVIYKDAQYVTTYEGFASLAGKDADFPIKPAIIEGYFDKGERAAYLRMADLLEGVHKNPPRDLPFSGTFKPRFNLLKFFALWGIHIFHALRFNPARLQKILPDFAAFAGRIYGYIDKAYVPKAKIEEMRKRIKQFVK
ncbi:MAG: surface carbohydrate biosynthesis protein [Oscillospiraceae bacterium]